MRAQAKSEWADAEEGRNVFEEGNAFTMEALQQQLDQLSACQDFQVSRPSVFQVMQRQPGKHFRHVRWCGQLLCTVGPIWRQLRLTLYVLSLLTMCAQCHRRLRRRRQSRLRPSCWVRRRRAGREPARQSWRLHAPWR
jgi:hypothetical protein